jgi:hypothetical protein
MKPLRRATLCPKSRQNTLDALNAQSNEWWAKMLNKPADEVTEDDKRAMIAHVVDDAGEHIWKNDVYQVHVRSCGHGPFGELVHLSLRRLDRAPVTDWRDKQAIKNQLCGGDAEGIELYPSESRVVDTSNQYHLWVFKGFPKGKSPFAMLGFPSGLQIDTPLGAAVQRAFDDEETGPKIVEINP